MEMQCMETSLECVSCEDLTQQLIVNLLALRLMRTVLPAFLPHGVCHGERELG